jgi:hypothetical protein
LVVWWSVSHEPLHTEDPHLNFHEPRDNLGIGEKEDAT